MRAVAESQEAGRASGRSNRRRSVAMIATGVVLVAAAAMVVALVVRRDGGDHAPLDLPARRAQVERRGATVMPFDQNATMHRFTHTTGGGVETITANDPNDTDQIALVQEHLTHERDLFAAGNFSDPMAIHGVEMPGIHDLQGGAAAGRITITYAAMPNGARLTYAATDPTLIDALHAWFDAQLMDHGSHATDEAHRARGAHDPRPAACAPADLPSMSERRTVPLRATIRAVLCARSSAG